MGIEPTAFSLARRHSTGELRPRHGTKPKVSFQLSSYKVSREIFALSTLTGRILTCFQPNTIDLVDVYWCLTNDYSAKQRFLK